MMPAANHNLQLVSPSAVVCAAAKVAPVTSMTAAVASNCVLCGHPIAAGEATNPVTRAMFTETFNNKLDVRAKRGHYICGHCVALWTKELMQQLGKTYATPSGVFKLSTDADLATLVLMPPEPPFVAVVSTTKTQHLIWRAPVNYSQETILIRFGDTVLTIRRKALLQAARDWRQLRELMLEGKMKGVAPIRLDRMIESKDLGEIRRDVAAAAIAAGDAGVLQRMAQLSPGELWALNVARNYIDTPVLPPTPVVV